MSMLEEALAKLSASDQEIDNAIGLAATMSTMIAHAQRAVVEVTGDANIGAVAVGLFLSAQGDLARVVASLRNAKVSVGEIRVATYNTMEEK